MGTNVNLTGTYGLTGQDGTSDNFTQVIKFNSYCAGTRDDPVTITVTDTDYNDGTYDIVYAGSVFRYNFISNSQGVVDGVIKIPGRQPAKFTTSINRVIDPYAQTLQYIGYLEASAGMLDGFIEIEIISYNNYPSKKIGPNVLIDTANYDPYTAAEPSIFVYVNEFEAEHGSTITGSIRLDGLYIGQYYSVSFFDTSKYIYYDLTTAFGDRNTGFVASSVSMDVNFEVPVTLFSLNKVTLRADVSMISAPDPAEQ